MCDKEYWQTRIVNSGTKFKCGYKLVFGPWNTLSNPDIVFLTPLPGLSVPEGANWRLLSEERGNSYKLEKSKAKSDINKQFLALADFIGVSPDKLLTGVATPFRAPSWKSLSLEQKQISREFGLEFWKKYLNQSSIRLIIVSGSHARNIVFRTIRGKKNKVDDCCAKYGDKRLRRFETECNKTIIHLPYLGSFHLFGKPECEVKLRKIFDGFIANPN